MNKPLGHFTDCMGKALLALALLSGCAVGPDYRRPATELPDVFSNAGQAGFSAQTVETVWWRLFKDSQLTGLIAQALQRNHDLESARARLREARALYLEAGLDLAPTVTAHANYTEQKRSVGALNNRSYVPRELKLYNAGFDAFWEIDFFGRVRRGLEADNADVEGQQASLRDVTVSLIAELARNYFQLRGLQHQLAVAQKVIDNQAETLAITREKLAAGRGTELDTARASAQLDASRATIPPLQAAISQAMHRLSVLTGQLPGALQAQLSRPLPLPEIPAVIQIGRPAELLRRRPDIRVAERGLAAATARVGVATGDLFPKVAFVGSIALEGGTMSGLTGPGSESYSVGPKISWAAFDLGRVHARIKAAGAEAEASLADYRQTVLNALEETENALVNYRQEQGRRALLTSAAAASEQASQLARQRYQVGVADFLTVLDSDQRLLQDQSQLAQSQTDTATALVALYKALGGGWEAGEEAHSLNR